MADLPSPDCSATVRAVEIHKLITTLSISYGGAIPGCLVVPSEAIASLIFNGACASSPQTNPSIGAWDND
jgi:hypothetical protein